MMQRDRSNYHPAYGQDRDGEECEFVQWVEDSPYPDAWACIVRFRDGEEREVWPSELDPIPGVPA